MKGSTYKPINRRTQSQGQLQLNLIEDCVNRTTNYQSKFQIFNGKERDGIYSQTNTPLKQYSPFQQSYSSGFKNSPQKHQNNQSTMFRTGLSFQANQSNEMKQIDQQKLTILHRTCADNYGDAKRSRDISSQSCFNTTFISSLDNKTPQLDYYSKNIITNQLLFKKMNIKSSQTQLRDKTSKQNSILDQVDLQQNEGIDNLKGFVKTLYHPSSKENKYGKFFHLKTNKADESSTSQASVLCTPSSSNSQFRFFSNTPKSRDCFVTKLNGIDFTSSKYSTMMQDSAKDQIKKLRIKVSKGNISEQTRLQKSSEKNSNNNSQKKDLKEWGEVQTNNYDNEQADIHITPMYEINNQAQNKILATFKMAGEIDRNRMDFKKMDSQLNLQRNSQSVGQSHHNGQDTFLEKYQVVYTEETNQPKKLEHNLLNKHIKHNSSKEHKNYALSNPNFNTNEHSFYCLFIFIDNLSNIKRKSNLKYKIIQIPQIYNSISKKKVTEDFEELKSSLKHFIGLNLKFMFFFQQNGTPLINHLSFTDMDYNNEGIFFGSQGSFSGVQGLACSEQNKQNLQSVISNLCSKVRVLNQNQKNNNSDSAVNIQNYQHENEMQDAFEKYKILTKEEISQIKNKFYVNRIAQTLTFNPNAKIKFLNSEEPSNVEKKSTQIEKQLQESINNTKKMILEAPDNFERQPDKNKFHNLREIAKYIDHYLLDTENKISKKQKKKLKKEKEESERYQGIEDLWNNQKQSVKTNYVLENIEKYNNKNSIMNALQKRNQELFMQNIPKLLNKYELSRHDLHSIYILYKALLNVSVQRTNYKEVFQKGVDFKTFELGVDRLSSQGEEIIKRMCNYNSFINWESFLEILSGIQGKSLESKINIFIKVSDTDKSGNLSKEEIEELCDICLQKFIPKGNDTIIAQLIEYFTRLLFSSLDVDINDSIPLSKLKDAIIGGHPESDLLCFFCGVN